MSASPMSLASMSSAFASSMTLARIARLISSLIQLHCCLLFSGRRLDQRLQHLVTSNPDSKR